MPTGSGDSFNQLLLNEAARVITLTEGGKPVSMPAGKAVTRATYMNAIKGNAHAQRTIMTGIASAEAAATRQRREEHDAALFLKLDLEDDLEIWLSKGRREEDMPIHPKDIEIDKLAGTVKNYAIFTHEGITARAQLIALRDYLIGRWPSYLELIVLEGDNIFQEIGRDRASHTIDSINKMLPTWRRRYLPGQSEEPLNLDQSPEQLWMDMNKKLSAMTMSRKKADADPSEGESADDD